MANFTQSGTLPIPIYGWRARGDRKVAEKRKAFTKPTLMQILDAVPFACRYLAYWVRNIRRRNELFIDSLRPLNHVPFYGVPCGALGTGSIGRDFRGGFCKFSLRPGIVEQKVTNVLADQFILTIRRGGTTIYHKVLGASRRRRAFGPMSAWDFSFPQDRIDYVGLYPRSWTTYEVPEHKVRLVCRQISPVLPGDYEESSLPTSVFEWQIEYNGASNLELIITFTFRDGTDGKSRALRGGSRSSHSLGTSTGSSLGPSGPSAGAAASSKEPACSSSLFESPSSQGDGSVLGVALAHNIDRMPLTYGLAALQGEGQRITRCLRWDPTKSGRSIWRDLSENGVVSLGYDRIPSEGADRLGVAICVAAHLKPAASEKIVFALSWDMPQVHFGAKSRQALRRYTRFYGSDCAAADRLCLHAIANYRNWDNAIEEWQRPVLSHSALPAWYKSALFNELYFLSDGGTVWLEFDSDWKQSEPTVSDYTAKHLEEYGRFAYLESWEYRMFNTYDVHFYASFSLAALFPQLELSMQTDICDQVFREDTKRVRYMFDGKLAPVKTKCRVPHDLGNPGSEPFLHVNAYRIHDTALWRDLNLKFVLSTYRDFAHVTNRCLGFLKHSWPKVEAIMTDALTQWDPTGEGLIENSGAADQTYDAWRMHGASAYCGGLWLAALQACRRMAAALGASDRQEFYARTLHKATEAYERRLWNGHYYLFDEGGPRMSGDTIMADQLCGLWFLGTCDPDDAALLLPPDRVTACLETIFNKNVMGALGGKMGAMNGVKPDGKIDRSSIQSAEIWTGVSYAVASLMIQRHQVDRGFSTAEGIYETVYNRTGLQYQTPEALCETKSYRAIGYMRPLAIWAIQWVLEHTHGFPNLPPTFYTRSGVPTKCDGNSNAKVNTYSMSNTGRTDEGESRPLVDDTN